MIKYNFEGIYGGVGTFGQFTFDHLTFHQFYIWSITTFGQLIQTHIHLVNFDLQGFLHLYIYLDIVYGTIVHIKLTDNRRPSSLVSSETKHELFAASSSIVLERYL